MKATTLCASVLSTLIIGGVTVSAAETVVSSMTTNGHVTVENGVIDKDGGVTDPEDPTEKLPLPELPNVKPNPNDTMGPLEITHAPAFKFGTVKTSNKDVEAFAENNTFTTEKGEQKRGAILQFGDLRTDINGYTVKAKMDKQFTQAQGENELKGATITLTNPLAATSDGSTGLSPDFEPSVKLGETSGSVILATADGTDKVGKGMWTVEYGSSTPTDTTGTSVKLLIPANTASSMAGGEYIADIEWSISTEPQS